MRRACARACARACTGVALGSDEAGVGYVSCARIVNVGMRGANEFFLQIVWGRTNDRRR